MEIRAISGVRDSDRWRGCLYVELRCCWRMFISGLTRIDGEHLQSPSRDDSRALLRASLSRCRFLAAVLAAAGFALAAAPLSPTPHSTATAPHASPASSGAVAGTARRPPLTPSHALLAPVGRSEARAAACVLYSIHRHRSRSFKYRSTTGGLQYSLPSSIAAVSVLTVRRSLCATC